MRPEGLFADYADERGNDEPGAVETTLGLDRARLAISAFICVIRE